MFWQTFQEAVVFQEIHFFVLFHQHVSQVGESASKFALIDRSSGKCQINKEEDDG